MTKPIRIKDYFTFKRKTEDNSMSGQPARKMRAENRALWRYLEKKGLKVEAEAYVGVNKPEVEHQ